VGSFQTFSERWQAGGLTRKQCRSTLQRGMALGYFAYAGRSPHDHRVRLYRTISQPRVMRMLGIDKAGPKVWLPDDCMASMDTFAAHLQSAFLTERNKPIPRAYLCEVFGVDERTLRRREKLAEIVVKPNELTAELPTNTAESMEYAANFSDVGPIAVDKNQKTKEVTTRRQLPNTYIATRTKFAPSGRSKFLKLTKYQKQDGERPQGPPDSKASPDYPMVAKRRFEGGDGTQDERRAAARAACEKWQSNHKNQLKTAVTFQDFGQLDRYPTPTKTTRYRLRPSYRAHWFDPSKHAHCRELEGVLRGNYDA